MRRWGPERVCGGDMGREWGGRRKEGRHDGVGERSMDRMV